MRAGAARSLFPAHSAESPSKVTFALVLVTAGLCAQGVGAVSGLKLCEPVARAGSGSAAAARWRRRAGVLAA